MKFTKSGNGLIETPCTNCTGTNTMPHTMIYEARKMHKATIAGTSTTTCCAHFNLHVWEVGKFSGVEMKSWEMDEGGKSRKRLGGGVSESNLSNLSFGNWFLLRRQRIDSQTCKGRRGREWEQRNQFAPAKSQIFAGSLNLEFIFSCNRVLRPPYFYIRNAHLLASALMGQWRRCAAVCEIPT